MSADWPIVKLGDVCSVIAGQSPAGSSFNTCGEGLPFYQGKKDFTERYIGAPTVWTTDVTKEALAGDILMSVRAPVGPINYATQRACIGRGLAAIRPEEVDPDFLFYNLLSKRSEIAGREGAVFASINRDEIKRISVPLPPLAEQQRIVVVLHEAFERIEAAIGYANLNADNARTLFQETLAAKMANHEWPMKAFEECLEGVRYTNKIQRKDFKAAGQYPIISQESDFINGFWNDASDLFRVYTPVVIFGDHTRVLKFVDFDFVLGADGVKILKPNSEFDAKFFYYGVRAIDLGRLGYARHYRLLREARLPCPDLKEQSAIVRLLDELEASVLQLEAVYRQKTALLSELKQSILARAFSGELTREPLAA